MEACAQEVHRAAPPWTISGSKARSRVLNLRRVVVNPLFVLGAGLSGTASQAHPARAPDVA